ncbi:hypothetical protein TrVGV298_001685 [Trichoderma virens]|nr:hypothetical protein TrVGV298_001685 [Trichoderma virens]
MMFDWRELEPLGIYESLQKIRATDSSRMPTRDRAEDDLATTVEEQQVGASSPLDFHDCQIFAKPEDNDYETQETYIRRAILHQNGNGDVDDIEVEVATDFAKALRLVSHRSAIKIPCISSACPSCRPSSFSFL